MSKQFMCPHCEEEGSQGKFPVMESKFTQVVYCNFKALVFLLATFNSTTFIRQLL